MDKRKINWTKRKFFFLYTALFILTAWIVFRYFWENDRTFVWVPDGWKQHYQALLYYSKWLRELFSRLFIQHNFNLPSYSFSLGYGADILTTLHYYAIGDPLTLFSVFVPENAMLYFYEFLIFFRIYLAGIAFSCYCFYRKKTSWYAVFSGTFIYIFCGYVMFAGVRHPYFLNPMIYLPLILLGVEKLWREKKPGLFVGSVCLSAISNFYFFYMLVILTVLYVVIRLLSTYQLTQWRKIASAVLGLTGYALLGVSLGAVILLPVILMFLGNSRLGTGYQFDFWYSSKYYKSFLPDLLTVASPGKWNRLGYAAIIIPAIFSLFSEIFGKIIGRCRAEWKKTPGIKREIEETKEKEVENKFEEQGEVFQQEVLKEDRSVEPMPEISGTQTEFTDQKPDQLGSMRVSKGALGVGFVLLTLFLLFPAAGYAMNGFAYVSNRWGWGYSMLLAFLVAVEWDELFFAVPKKLFMVGGLTAIYTFLCIILRKDIGVIGKENLRISLIFLALCLVCLAVACLENVWKRKKEKKSQSNLKEYKEEIIEKQSGILVIVVQAVLFGFTLINIGAMAYYQYSENYGNYISDFRKKESFYKSYAASEIGAVTEASKEETEFFRYTGHELVSNASLGSGFSSTQFYWSLSNGNIWNYFIEQELAEHSSFNYQGLDDRTALCALAGVKYYIAGKNGINYIPYGYEKVKISKKYRRNYATYKNTFSLPLGYTYKNYILKKDYERLDSLAKQEAMLQGLVVSEKVDGFDAIAPTATAREIDFVINYDSDRIQQEENYFYVKKKGAKIELTFDGLPECETYLALSGLFYNWGGNKDVSQSMILMISAQDELGANVEKEFTYKGAKDVFYNGRHDYIINLCYSKNKKVSVSIEFPRTGTYKIDSMKVLCQPLKLYEESVNQLCEETLINTNLYNDNPVAATNRVTGEITLSEPKLLALAIPYSAGWKAFVDGKEQELLQANTMYFALALTEGKHKIELRYKTPGLAAGFGISVFGLAVWIGLTIKIPARWYKKANKQTEISKKSEGK